MTNSISRWGGSRRTAEARGPPAERGAGPTPIFFVNIGLSVNARTLEPEMIVFTLVIILTAILGKWVGAGTGARLGGLNLRESVQLGAGMISRGEVGLIVAGVGITEGMVSSEEFSAVVAMVLVTTVFDASHTVMAICPEKSQSCKCVTCDRQRVERGESKK